MPEDTAPPTERPPAERTRVGEVHARSFPKRSPEPVLSGKLPSGIAFDSLRQGILPEFTTGRIDKNGYGSIDHGAWMRACAEETVIGSCRRCGAFVLPRRPIEHDGVFEYQGYCRRSIEARLDPDTLARHVDGCGWEFTAPRGKVLLRSSSRSERRAAVSKRGNAATNASPSRDEPPF